jgi:hypothetical protein
MIWPDRWNDRCPQAREATPYELRDMLRVPEITDGFSAWERSFCLSLYDQLKRRPLSNKQLAILDRGLLRRCWMNDPDLWGSPLPPTPLAQVVPTPSLKHRWRTTRRMLDRALFNNDTATEMVVRADLTKIEQAMDHGRSWEPPF